MLSNANKQQTSSISDLTRLREKLNALQSQGGQSHTIEHKSLEPHRKRHSKQVENKENLEIDYFEAETARIHKEYIEGGSIESNR